MKEQCRQNVKIIYFYGGSGRFLGVSVSSGGFRGGSGGFPRLSGGVPGGGLGGSGWVPGFTDTHKEAAKPH